MDKMALQEVFFNAVSKGSVEEVRTFVATHGWILTKELVNSSIENGGDTPLFMAVKGNQEKMVYFLEQLTSPIRQIGSFVWRGLRYEGVPPTFVALVCGNKIRPAIIESLTFKEVTGGNFLQSVVSGNNTQQQKIDALELVGAAFILEDFGVGKHEEFGLDCWKQAMVLRQATSGEPAIPKTGTHERIVQLFNTTEVATTEELEVLAVGNKKLLLIQALVVLHRILQHAHPIPSLFFLHHFSRFILYNKEVYLNSMEPIHVANALLFILEAFHDHQWETGSGSDLYYVNSVFRTLWRCFNELPTHLVSIESLLKATWLFSIWDSKQEQPEPSLISLYVSLLFYSIDMLCIQQPISKETNRFLSRYIPLLNQHLNIIGRLYGKIYNKGKLQSMIGLLVKVGSNPNATAVFDDDSTEGNTPLHLLLMQCDPDVSPSVIALMKLLVNAGAHLDQMNSSRQSPLTLFKELEVKRAEMKLPAVPELQNLFRSVLPLSCYSAQVVANHFVQYPQKDICKLPCSIRSFINLH